MPFPSQASQLRSDMPWASKASRTEDWVKRVLQRAGDLGDDFRGSRLTSGMHMASRLTSDGAQGTKLTRDMPMGSQLTSDVRT